MTGWNLLILIVETALLGGLLITLHRLGARIGSAPLVALVVTLVVFSQFSLRSLVYIQLSTNIYLVTGAFVSISVVLAAVLLLYLLNGSAAARILILCVLGASVLVSLSAISDYFHLVLPGGGSFLGLAGDDLLQFIQARSTLASLVAFALDLLLITIIYQAFRNLLPSAPFWFFPGFALLLTLWADTLIYQLLCCGLSTVDALIDLTDDLLGKTLTGLTLWPILAIYIGYYFRLKSNNAHPGTLLSSIFFPLKQPRPVLDLLVGDPGRLQLQLLESESALRESEQLFRRIFEQSSDAIVLVDGQGLIIEWNHAAEKITGYLAAQVLNRPFWEIQHDMLPDDRKDMLQLEKLRTSVKETLRTGQSPWTNRILQNEFIHADGSKRYVQQVISLIQTGGSYILFNISRDITGQKRAEQEQTDHLQRMQKQQAALIELSMHPAISSGILNVAASSITEITSKAIQVERVSIWLLDQDQQRLVCIDLYERTPDRHSSGLILTASNYPRYFDALRTGRAIDAHQAHNDLRTSEFAPGYLTPLGIGSMLDAAIRQYGEVIGVLCFEHVGEPRTWLPDEILFSASGADQFRLALLNRERLQTEQRLLISEQKFSRAYQAAPIAMVITRAADRAYLDVNDAFLQLTGYTRQELLGRPSTDLNLWADPDQRQHLLQLFSTQDRLVDAEFAFRQKSGALRIGLMSAEHIELNDEACVLTSMRDITESKQAEEALRQYTQRLEILRMIDQAILSEGSPIASTPEAIAHATLSNLQRLLPCPFSGVFSFDFPSRHTNMLAAIGPGADLLEDCISMQEYFLSEDLREVLVVEKQDLEKLNPNGDLERILTSYDIQTLLNIPLVAQGELIGALLLTSDAPAYFQPDRIEVASEVAAMLAVAIQQARLHQQVQRQTEDLEERVQQRTAEMEAKNRELETFTYSVSHDLKAPLRGVDGYSRLLMEGYANLLDEEGRTFLLRIREGVVRMGQLIEDLLAYSKLEQRSLHKSQVYLPVIIENLLAERRSEIQESKIVVTTNISCHFVYAEVEGLSQALRNLFDNAIKFTRDAPQPHIEIGGRVTSNSCILWVKDNGIGFDMQYQSRIFEIFQRLNRMEEYPGTGVGLAIVRKAMQRMGGRVWAESSPGAGATFYLEMPEG